jgi:hypothetical protein
MFLPDIINQAYDRGMDWSSLPLTRPSCGKILQSLKLKSASPQLTYFAVPVAQETHARPACRHQPKRLVRNAPTPSSV